MAHHRQLGGMAHPCAARSASLTGWGPRLAPASLSSPALNMTVRDFNHLSINHGNFSIKHGTLQSNTGTLQTNMGTLQSNTGTFQARALSDQTRALSTRCNATSSRSHSICIVSVTGRQTKTGATTHGKLNLVDLAGTN